MGFKHLFFQYFLKKTPLQQMFFQYFFQKTAYNKHCFNTFLRKCTKNILHNPLNSSIVELIFSIGGTVMAKVNYNTPIGTFATLCQALFALYEPRKAALNDSKLDSFFDSVKAGAEEIIATSNSAPLLSKLDEADTKRDTVVRNFFTIMEAACLLPFSEEAEAAKALLPVFERYGRQIVAEKYREESAKIESLLKDLEGADLSKIHGAAEYAALLRTAEDEFKAANTLYTESKTAASSDKSAGAKKKVLLDFVNNTLLKYLKAMCVVDGEKYGDFAKAVDEEIARSNESIKVLKK